jgi:pyrroloquinoline quinone (PQQ) biosynthesis protein C
MVTHYRAYLEDIKAELENIADEDLTQAECNIWKILEEALGIEEENIQGELDNTVGLRA